MGDCTKYGCECPDGRCGFEAEHVHLAGQDERLCIVCAGRDE